MFHTDDGRGRKIENLEEFDDAREVRMSFVFELCALKLSEKCISDEGYSEAHAQPGLACWKPALLLHGASETSTSHDRWSRHCRASTRPASAPTISRALQVHRPPQPARTAGPRPSPWPPNQATEHSALLRRHPTQFCMRPETVILAAHHAMTNQYQPAQQKRITR